MSETLFDAQGFARRIRVAMAERNISYRQCAEEVGTDQATLHRVAVKERPPCVETYLRLERWLAQEIDRRQEKP